RHVPPPPGGPTGASGRPESVSRPRRGAHRHTPRARGGRHFVHASVVAGPARARPGFSSNKGKAPCCWPHVSTSWRTAHVRGTNVISPTPRSRHHPSVRLQ